MSTVSAAFEQPRLDDAALLRAVDRDEDAILDVGRRLAEQPALREPEEAVLAGKRARASEHHHRVLPERLEREVRREE